MLHRTLANYDAVCFLRVLRRYFSGALTKPMPDLDPRAPRVAAFTRRARIIATLIAFILAIRYLFISRWLTQSRGYFGHRCGCLL